MQQLDLTRAADRKHPAASEIQRFEMWPIHALPRRKQRHVGKKPNDIRSDFRGGAFVAELGAVTFRCRTPAS
jgi:hypothetical protein